MPGSLKVIAPGTPGFIEAGRALASPRRRAGVWPYQWLFPGPNSKSIKPFGNAEVSALDTPVELLRYTVSDGMRLSLRGVTLRANFADWTEGDGNVTFTIEIDGVGSRAVDFWRNVPTNYGSSEKPWPIDGRLEFQSQETLVVTCTATGTVTPPGVAFAMLVGHEYPNSEAGDD